MNKMTVYVVDDEKKIRDLIASYLVKEGYQVEVFEDGLPALEKFRKTPADMLIIDIMMPGMDGYSLCREIRKESDVPIIMVSAKDDEIDRILGLELGSDDYISKPFSTRELVARVKTIFRRVTDTKPKASGEINEIKCGRLKILSDERRILVKGKEIEVTTKEYDFLQYVAKNLNRAFTRDQLLNSVWGYEFIGDTRAVDDLVKRLRKKLDRIDSGVEIITVWGYGYKLSQTIIGEKNEEVN